MANRPFWIVASPNIASAAWILTRVPSLPLPSSVAIKSPLDIVSNSMC